MIKIIRSSKESVNIDYNGREARFLGDIVHGGFRAFANTMKWVLPHSKQEPATETEKYEVMMAVTLHFKGVKDRIFFVDDKGDELKFSK